MKKLGFLLIAGLLFSTVSMAQSRNDLKGPKAKNYKHWKHEDTKTNVLFTSESTPKGPAAKNSKPWRNSQTVIESALIVDLNNNRKNITGPKAKNSEPWELMGGASLAVDDSLKQEEQQEKVVID